MLLMVASDFFTLITLVPEKKQYQLGTKLVNGIPK